MSLFLLVIVFAFSPSGQASEPFDLDGAWGNEGDVTRAFEMARRLDPKKNSSWRENIEGGLRTTMGAQVGPSCLKQLPDHLKKNRREVVTRLDFVLAHAVSRMLVCRNQYPELSPYIDEWLSTARRSVYECVSERSSELGFAGLSDREGTTTLPSDIFFDFHRWSTEESVELGFDKIHFGPLLGVLIHENLHSTRANNRFDHNSLEAIGANNGLWVRPRESCAENIAVDRVNVIESLCNHSFLNFSQESAQFVLADRIAKCGMSNGCERVFTDGANNIPWYWPDSSRDLSATSARRLCQRIQDDAHCLSARRKHGQTLTSRMPGFQSMQRRLRERLQALFPTKFNQIPAALLALYPKSQAAFSKIEGNACFNAMFRRGETGTLYMTKGDSKENGQPNDLLEFLLPSIRDLEFPLSNAYSALFSNLREYSKKAKACADEKERNEVFETASTFFEAVDRDLKRSRESLVVVFEVVLGRRFLSPKESFAKLAPAYDSEIGRLIGPELYANFVKVMRSSHYASPYFDCVAAGLSPFRSAEMALGALKRVQGLGQIEGAACSVE